MGFPGGSDGKESTCNAGDLVPPLGWEGPLEKRMATHSSILAWRIPWTEDPGRLLSRGSQRVGHDWVTSVSFTFLHNICILALCSGSIIAKQVYPRCDYCYYKWVKFISRMHFWAYMCMRVCSVASNSLQSYGLLPARLLYPCMGFSRQEYWSGVPLPGRSVFEPSGAQIERRLRRSLVAGGRSVAETSSCLSNIILSSFITNQSLVWFRVAVAS